MSLCSGDQGLHRAEVRAPRVEECRSRLLKTGVEEEWGCETETLTILPSRDLRRILYASWYKCSVGRVGGAFTQLVGNPWHGQAEGRWESTELCLPP